MRSEVSDEFRNAFMSGGAFISQECMCGRVHFCSPENSQGDFEDGEYERLKELSIKEPKKYIESNEECISYFDMGMNVIVWGCECHNDIWYENTIWSDRHQIMSYYREKLESIERSFLELSSEVHSVNFKFEQDSNDKCTFEEFINKMREYKLNDLLK